VASILAETGGGAIITTGDVEKPAGSETGAPAGTGPIGLGNVFGRIFLPCERR